MTPQDIKEIIPQLPGESDRSYERLIIMLKKGFKSLEELSEYLQKENHELKVTHSTLENNSANDNWTERRKKYREIRDQEIQEEMEQLFHDLNTRGIRDMTTFLDELQEVKEKEMQLFHEEGKKPSSVLFTLRNYIKCYREATEIYYINSRHTLFPQEQENNTDNTKDYDKIREAIRGKTE